METLPRTWQFCHDRLASIRLHRWLHGWIQASQTEWFSECQAAGRPGDWRDRTRSRVWSSRGLVWIYQQATCRVLASLSKKKQKEKKSPHWFRASVKCFPNFPSLFFFLGKNHKIEHKMYLVTSWNRNSDIRQVHHHCLPSLWDSSSNCDSFHTNAFLFLRNMS